jgi:BASS family bile acid:Na+ symporter
MSLAYGLARAARLSPPRVVALTLECGIQNGSLAMFVAATLLQDQMMMLPGAAYGLLMFPTAFLFVFVFLQKDRRSALKRIVP